MIARHNQMANLAIAPEATRCNCGRMPELQKDTRTRCSQLATANHHRCGRIDPVFSVYSSFPMANDGT